MAFISDIRCYIMYLNILFKLSHLLRGSNVIPVTCHDCEVLFSFYVAVVLKTYLFNCQSHSCQILEYASLNCIQCCFAFIYASGNFLHFPLTDWLLFWGG